MTHVEKFPVDYFKVNAQLIYNKDKFIYNQLTLTGSSCIVLVDNLS